METISSAAGKEVAGLGGSLLEKFGLNRPNIEATPDTRAEVVKRLEGNELIAAARQGMDAAHKAAASADTAVGKHDEAKKRRQEAKAEVDKTRRVARLVERRQVVSDEDFARLDAVAEGRDLSAVEADKALRDMAKARRDEAQQRKSVIEARGKLPKVSLEKDEKMVATIESSQQRQLEAGKIMITVLKREPLTIDELREAHAAGTVFDKAVESQIKTFDKLEERLNARYPDKAGDVKTARQKIDSEAQGKRDAIKVGEPVDMDQEGLIKQVEAASAVVSREENKKRLEEELGVKWVLIEPGDAEMETVVEGSLMDQKMKAEAQVVVLDKAFAEAVAAAEADPMLADKALSIALTRHTANKAVEIANSRVLMLQEKAKAEEAAQMSKERAAAERNITAQALAEGYDKAVSGASKFAAKATSGLGRLLGGSLAKVGRALATPFLAAEKVGLGIDKTMQRAGDAAVGLVEERRDARETERLTEIERLTIEQTRLADKIAALRAGKQ